MESCAEPYILGILLLTKTTFQHLPRVTDFPFPPPSWTFPSHLIDCDDTLRPLVLVNHEDPRHICHHHLHHAPHYTCASLPMRLATHAPYYTCASLPMRLTICTPHDACASPRMRVTTHAPHHACASPRMRPTTRAHARPKETRSMHAMKCHASPFQSIRNSPVHGTMPYCKAACHTERHRTILHGTMPHCKAPCHTPPCHRLALSLYHIMWLLATTMPYCSSCTTLRSHGRVQRSVRWGTLCSMSMKASSSKQN